MSSTGKYIVVFKDGTTKEQIDNYADQVDNNGGKVTHRYDSILSGFSAAIPNHFLSSLQGSDIIAYIEPDGVVTTQ